MAKKTINLLILKEEETTLEKKIKFILPVLAGVLTGAFLFLYVVSLTITRNYRAQYNLLNSEENLLESKIKNVKNTEGLYTSAVNLVNSIDGLLQTNKNLIVSYIPRVSGLTSASLDIGSMSIDNKGSVVFTVKADDLSAVDKFIAGLIAKTDKFPFNNIIAHSIVRDKQGRYTFKITLNIAG